MAGKFQADYEGKTYEFDWDGPTPPTEWDATQAIQKSLTPPPLQYTQGPDPSKMHYDPSGSPEPWLANIAGAAAGGIRKGIEGMQGPVSAGFNAAVDAYGTPNQSLFQDIRLPRTPEEEATHPGYVVEPTGTHVGNKLYGDDKTQDTPSARVGRSLTEDIGNFATDWQVLSTAGAGALPKWAEKTFGTAAALSTGEKITSAYSKWKEGGDPRDILEDLTHALGSGAAAYLMLKGFKEGKGPAEATKEATTPPDNSGVPGDILHKFEKLMELARRNTNANEARVAAQKAADLKAKYGIKVSPDVESALQDLTKITDESRMLGDQTIQPPPGYKPTTTSTYAGGEVPAPVEEPLPPTGAVTTSGTRPLSTPPLAESAPPSARPKGIQTSNPIEGWVAESNPKTGTMGIKGPNGQRLALSVMADRIELVTIYKGEDLTSEKTVDALREIGQALGLPVRLTSTNLSSSGGKFRRNMLERGEITPAEDGNGYLLGPKQPKPSPAAPLAMTPPPVKDNILRPDEFEEGPSFGKDSGEKGDDGVPKEGKLLQFPKKAVPQAPTSLIGQDVMTPEEKPSLQKGSVTPRNIARSNLRLVPPPEEPTSASMRAPKEPKPEMRAKWIPTPKPPKEYKKAGVQGLDRDFPKDELGSPILPGQESWTMDERRMVHQSAKDIVNDIVRSGKLNPVRFFGSTDTKHGENTSIAQTSHKAGTPLESLIIKGGKRRHGYEPTRMQKALNSKYTTALKLEIHKAIYDSMQNDPQYQEWLEKKSGDKMSPPPSETRVHPDLAADGNPINGEEDIELGQDIGDELESTRQKFVRLTDEEFLRYKELSQRGKPEATEAEFSEADYNELQRLEDKMNPELAKYRAARNKNKLTPPPEVSDTVDTGEMVEDTEKAPWDDPDTQMADMGGGKAVGVTQPRLIRELGANLYAGDLGTVIVKEGLQNAVDSIKKGTTGNISVVVNTNKKSFTIIDDGVGMSPDVIKNQFLDPGGTYKPEGNRGGYGIAKVALFSQAKDIEVISTALVDGKLIQSRLTGDGERWLDPENPMTVETREVPEGTPTGTLFGITLNDGAKVDAYQTKNWLEKFLTNNKVGHNMTMKVDGLKVEPQQDWDYKTSKVVSAQTKLIATEKVPGGEIEYYTGPKSQDTKYVRVEIMNHGLPQFTIEMGLLSEVRMPTKIQVNIKSGLDTESADYPFTPNRQQLRDDTEKAVKKFIMGKLVNAGIKEQQGRYKKALENHGIIPGTKGRMVIEPGQKVSKKTLEEIASTDIVARVDRLTNMMLKITSTFMAEDDLSGTIRGRLAIAERAKESNHHNDTTKYDETTNELKTAGLKKHPFMTFKSALGFSGQKWYGVNINAAAAFGKISADDSAPVLSAKQQPWLILVDPWAIVHTFIPRDVPLMDQADRFGEELWATIVHELIHNRHRGHDESFSSDVTHLLPRTRKQGAKLIRKIREEVTRDPHFFDALRIQRNVLQEEYTAKPEGEDVLESITTQSAVGGDKGRDLEGSEAGRLQDGSTDRVKGTMRAPRPGFPARKKHTPPPEKITPPPGKEEIAEPILYGGMHQTSAESLEYLRKKLGVQATGEKKYASPEDERQAILSQRESALLEQKHKLEGEIIRKKAAIAYAKGETAPMRQHAIEMAHRIPVLNPVDTSTMTPRQKEIERHRLKEERKGVPKVELQTSSKPPVMGMGATPGRGKGRPGRKSNEEREILEQIREERIAEDKRNREKGSITLGMLTGEPLWRRAVTPPPGWQDPANPNMPQKHRKPMDKVFELHQGALMSSFSTALKQLSDLGMQVAAPFEKGIAGALEESGATRALEHMINQLPGAENRNQTFRQEAERFMAEAPAHIQGLITSFVERTGDDVLTLMARQYGELDENRITTGPMRLGAAHQRSIGGVAGYRSRFFQRLSGALQGASEGAARGGAKGSQGVRLARQLGQTGTRASNTVDRIVHTDAKYLPEDMYHEILQEAQERTLVEDLSGIWAKMNNVRRKMPTGRWWIPFYQVAVNQAKQAYQRTPGISTLHIADVLHQAYKGKIKGGKIATELSKPLFGWMVGATLFMLLDKGIIEMHGGNVSPGASEKNYNAQEAGKTPYTIVIHGRNVPMEAFGPAFGPTMAIVANFHEALKGNEKMKQPGEYKQDHLIAKKYLSAIMETLNPSFLRDLTDLLGLTNAATNPESMARFERASGYTAAGGLVPRILSRYALATDSDKEGKGVQRSVASDSTLDQWFNTIKRDIPGARETLPELKSRTGEVVRDDRGAISRFMSPYKTTPTFEDVHKIEKEFDRLGWVPPSVASSLTVRGQGGVPEKMPLSEDQKARLYGSQMQATEIAKKFMAGPSYEGMPDWQKRDVLAKIYGALRRGSQARMRGELRRLPPDDSDLD